MYSDEDRIPSGCPIFVLSDTVCLGNMLFASDADWRPIEEVSDLLPEVSAAPAQAASVKDPVRGKDVDLAVLPWLLDLLGPTGWGDVGSTTSKPRRGQAASDDDDMASDADDCHVDAEAVMDALLKKRHELAVSCETPAEHFRYQLRGGAWTSEHRGVAFDSFMASVVKGSPAEAWCVEWGLTRSGSWGIAKYGEAGALCMAKSWVRLHEWLYCTWEACSDQVGWSFSDDVMSEYEESPELQDLYSAGPQPVRDRIAGMRKIRPRKIVAHA